MCLAQAWATKKLALRLISRVMSQAFSLPSMALSSITTPALLTR